jgi:uncharacterized protein YbbK (DUF523 family)/uncharacterized protein YbgA (DUF1722 family)
MAPEVQSGSGYDPAAKPIRIGVSACLLGEPVRYDGQHRSQAFLTEALGRYFEWVPVCPEVELGLGVPRARIRLERHRVGRRERIRLIHTGTGQDLTKPMSEYSARRVAELLRLDLRGFVLKARSPSCGLDRVAVHGPRGAPARTGRGLFVAELLRLCPQMPVEDEIGLAQAQRRTWWLERVFALERLTQFWQAGWSVEQLARFHDRQELILMAHQPDAFARLKRLIGNASQLSRRELRLRYERQYMAALARPASRVQHAQVLRHILGQLSGKLDPPVRQSLASLISDYRRGRLPLLCPLAVLRHYAVLLDPDRLATQSYLDRDQRELTLLGGG